MVIDARNARRIVLIKPSALGDIVQALPVLTAVRRGFPRARLAWIIHQAYAPLLEGHPHLDEIITMDRHLGRDGFVSGLLASLRFAQTLRRRHFDLAIDLQGLLRSGLVAWASGAPTRIGLASAREGSRCLYTHHVADDRGREHAVDRYWHVAEALGLGDLPREFTLPRNIDGERWAQESLAGLPRPLIGVSVGSRWLTKRWPPDFFHDLLWRAGRMTGGSAIFLGSRQERTLADFAAAGLAMPTLNLSGRTTLPQLTSLLRRVDVMLSNDTGPLHLAVALGRPIVAPYTCTQVRRNGPYGQESRAVETSVSCAGSYLRQCARLDCMRELTPERLWPTLREILLQWQRSRLSA